ncbi:uncharacterized protein LOC62_01G001692 [Vanrija pseudolonga]|uniref:SCP domain-containing protein n=1 Tax=Vanrija pseudolonga TaxID=143232 RepID=A0AAF0Y5I0_9TREE|nr:hypothetical protein LOC62_01G001692 [Vanrija pseudolonga]
MKFSPLILVALVSAASAAPAARDGPAKCRPKPGKEVSASPSASPSAAPTGSEGGEGARPVEVSSSASSSSAAAPTAVSAAPTAESAAPSPSAAPTVAANSTSPTDCNIPEVANQSYFLDLNVVVQMPPSRGPDPKATTSIVPPGSVGINPAGGIPADDPVAKVILERINQFRSIYKAPPMAWNETISGYAVGFGKRCIYEHFMKGDGLNGEVLLDFGPLTERDLAYEAKRWIDAWMIEGKQWDYNNQKTVAGQTTSHWEVLTDPFATQVGCGWQETMAGLLAKDPPDSHGDRVRPQTCEKIPWAWYIDPDQPDKTYPDTW